MEKGTQKMKQDHISPLAKARDEWLDSKEGEIAQSVNILYDSNQRVFLENRLIMAFIAGWDASAKLRDELKKA